MSKSGLLKGSQNPKPWKTSNHQPYKLNKESANQGNFIGWGPQVSMNYSQLHQFSSSLNPL